MNGIDISNWQPTDVPERVPCDFVFVKATGGPGFVNERLAGQVASARRAGKPVGAYHFARDGWTGTTAEEEAAHFLKHLPAGALPVLDWESDNVHDTGWAARWLDIVERATGVVPLVYMNLSVATRYDWESARVAGRYPLWLAWYLADNRIDWYVPPLPEERVKAELGTSGWDLALWQYTQKGRLPGYAGDLDLNVMYRDVFAQTAAPRDLVAGLGGLSA